MTGRHLHSCAADIPSADRVGVADVVFEMKKKIKDYLAPIIEQMSDAKLKDYGPSLMYICQKLSEQWTDEELGEPRRDVAKRFIDEAIKERKL